MFERLYQRFVKQIAKVEKDIASLTTSLDTAKQDASEKDATGGYVGLTLFKINFKNVANTFISFFTNSNTAARTYTFQDRDGTIIDDTNLVTGATDNAIIRADGTGGKTTQSSGVLVDDNNNIVLPTTTQAATSGIIYKGSVRFAHNYYGNYAGMNGNNLFVGLNAGNFTLNAVAAVYEGSFNVAVGDSTLTSITTGYNNVALGFKALTLNTTGSNNFGLGAFSLEKVTTGGGNTAVGTESAEYTTGSSNTIVGKRAGQGVNGSSTYSQTVALGFQALQALTTGGNNIAVGCYAGDLLTTGGNNIIIGYNIDPTANSSSNQLNIGGVIKGTGMYGTGLIGINVSDATTIHSSLQTNGSFALSYIAKTATYTATAADYIIDCTANTFTVTLPTAVGCTGRIYVVKNSGAGVITVATTSSQTIDGVTTKSLATQYDKITVQSNGANWIVISY